MKTIKTLIVTILFGVIVTGCDVLINPQAKIVVTRGSTTINNNAGVFDFGKVEVDKSNTVIFKIESKGKKSLKLTGTPVVEIQGQDNNAFTISTQPETLIKTGESTTFELKFSPAESKFYEAAVSIANNDLNENPFVFTIKGRGIIIDIDVRQGNTHIANDNGLFNFGELYLGNPTVTFTFTIENIGTTTLYLTGTQNLIEIQGYGASAFKINQTRTDSELDPGETTTFDITFDPQTGGVKSAKILFENSDPDENPYNFMIRGICLSPEIQVLDPDENDIPNITGEYVFPDNHLNNSRMHTFTIKNLGTTNLILSGSPIINISGTNSEVFTVTEQPEDTISPSSQTTFTIAFKPTFEAIYSATVTFANNDEDENPFIFTIRGLGYATKFDFNGDGFDDVIIGSRHRTHRPNICEFAYVFFGKDNYPKNVKSDNADIVFRKYNANDNLFPRVCAIGDVNKDGYDDLAISFMSEDDKTHDCGVVLIHFGSQNPPTELKYSEADVKIAGVNENDGLGSSISSVGDFNNDGYDDIIIGVEGYSLIARVAGAAVIFFGRQNWESKLDFNDADVRIVSDDRNSNLGWYVSSAGDFNGDGFDDAIVTGMQSSIGGVCIFLGKTSPLKIYELTQADVILLNVGGGTKAGDINNDGFEDIIAIESSGDALIYLGDPDPSNRIIASHADAIIHGIVNDHFLGMSVSNAGDINNDGFSDVMIGKSGNDNENIDGKIFIFYGNSSLSPLMLYSDADVIINTIKPVHSNHKTISSAGDFNGDRIDDIIFIELYDYSTVYMLFGKTNLNSTIDLADTDIIFESYSPDIVCGLNVSGGN